ncbi:MAG: right-handed parallel beta-helix repeat-containing protein, partial [Candidatus Yanofskybacteria bacterium]|nr:right-handed parallel beta-helix repeat-containing protein [Candidatus Yanofskybacteria bacterium]
MKSVRAIFIGPIFLSMVFFAPFGSLKSLYNGIKERVEKLSVSLSQSMASPTTDTFYVATTGNDINPGTADQPWKTIQKAANTVQAGDTVMVREGTYDERVKFSAGHSGSDGKKITFIASPLKSVTMQGFDTTNANYLRIEGFNITGSPPWWLGGGVWVASNNVEIVGNYFYDLHGPGVLTSWAKPWPQRPQNISVSNNRIYNSGAGIFASGDNWLVENNEVERLYRYSDSPDSDYARFFGSNITFKNNFFHGTLQSEIGASHVDCFQTFDTNDEYAQHILVENNTCYDYAQGLMAEAKKNRNSFDLTFRNNIFAHSWAWGLSVVAVTDVKVYNNVFADMKYHGVGFSDGATGEVKNNIFYNAGSNYWADAKTNATVTGGYNILNKESYPKFKTATDIINDPLFVDAANNDFHLKSNSPAIDAGTAISGFNYDKDGTTRPQGTAWDIGAYETAGSVTPPPTPTLVPSSTPTPTPPPPPANNVFYIRDGGTSSNCTDWTNACDSLPSTLQRGVTYYIADGSYPGYTFDDPVSGTQTITIKKATAGDHGTNTGWQSTYGDGQAEFTNLVFLNDYFVFDGQIGGGPGAWASGYGFKVASAISSGSGQLVTLGAGADNITMSHVEITALNLSDGNKQQGIKGVGGNSNLTFSYLNIHTLFGVPFHIGSWSNVVIEYSRVAHNRNTADWHTEGISSIGTNSNITIRYNIWDDIDGTAVIAGVNSGTSNDWKIYGNIFARSVTPIAYYNESGGTNRQTMNNLEFYNNVVTGTSASQGGVYIQSGTNNKVYNNIWYDNNVNALAISGTKNSNYFSKNIRTEGCNPACDKNPEGAAGDSSAQITSINPFVNWNTNMEAASADFRLVGATNAGVSLAAPFNQDALGTIRGADGVWDRGAYEYAGGAVTFTPTPSSTPTPTLLPTTTTPAPTPIPDTTRPTINSWDVQPRTITTSSTSGTTTVSWNVSDAGGSFLSRVEIQRAPFNSSNCNDSVKTDCLWT